MNTSILQSQDYRAQGKAPARPTPHVLYDALNKTPNNVALFGMGWGCDDPV